MDGRADDGIRKNGHGARADGEFGVDAQEECEDGDHEDAAAQSEHRSQQTRAGSGDAQLDCLGPVHSPLDSS